MQALLTALSTVAGLALITKLRILIRVAVWQFDKGEEYLSALRKGIAAGEVTEPPDIGRVLIELRGDRWYFGVYPYQYWCDCILPLLPNRNAFSVKVKGLLIRFLSVNIVVGLSAIILLLDAIVFRRTDSVPGKYFGGVVSVLVQLVMIMSLVVLGTATMFLREARPFHARLPEKLRANDERYIQSFLTSYVGALAFAWLASASAINYVGLAFGGFGFLGDFASLHGSGASVAFDGLAMSLFGALQTVLGMTSLGAEASLTRIVAGLDVVTVVLAIVIVTALILTAIARDPSTRLPLRFANAQPVSVPSQETDGGLTAQNSEILPANAPEVAFPDDLGLSPSHRSSMPTGTEADADMLDAPDPGTGSGDKLGGHVTGRSADPDRDQVRGEGDTKSA